MIGKDLNCCPPWPAVEEVHGGSEGRLEPPGGAGAAATEGSRGDSRVCASAPSHGVVGMEGPGQTGKTPLRHHPQL